jgi:hypothetical protein
MYVCNITVYRFDIVEISPNLIARPSSSPRSEPETQTQTDMGEDSMRLITEALAVDEVKVRLEDELTRYPHTLWEIWRWLKDELNVFVEIHTLRLYMASHMRRYEEVLVQQTLGLSIKPANSRQTDPRQELADGLIMRSTSGSVNSQDRRGGEGSEGGSCMCADKLIDSPRHAALDVLCHSSSCIVPHVLMYFLPTHTPSLTDADMKEVLNAAENGGGNAGDGLLSQVDSVVKEETGTSGGGHGAKASGVNSSAIAVKADPDKPTYEGNDSDDSDDDEVDDDDSDNDDSDDDDDDDEDEDAPGCSDVTALLISSLSQMWDSDEALSAPQIPTSLRSDAD